MSVPIATSWRSWSRLLAMCGVLGLAACPAESAQVRLATAMRPPAAKVFASLVADHNKTHPSSQIVWTNAANEAELASNAAAEWIVVSAETARRMPKRHAFTHDVAPKLTTGLMDGFRNVHRVDASDAFFPLLAVQALFIADGKSVERTTGAMPATIGDLLKMAAAHRQKSGRFLLSPAFGNGEQLLRFVWSQGATVMGQQGEPVFPAGELAAVLSPWVERFRAGDLPRNSFDWDEQAAARHVISGQSDVVFGGKVAVDVIASRPDKMSRRFNFFRPPTGVVSNQLLEPIGLCHRQSGGVSLAAQNMIAFLLADKSQLTLADGYEAMPLATVEAEAHTSVGLSPSVEAYLAAVGLYSSDGMPLMPLELHRPDLADALRMALKDAVDGMPIDAAISKAESWFKQRLSTT